VVDARLRACVVQLLLNLAEAAKLKEKIQAMFNGENINVTEDRAVLHVATRARRDQVPTHRPSCCAPWLTKRDALHATRGLAA
jgi:glucose-6-phosphate isomerase